MHFGAAKICEACEGFEPFRIPWMQGCAMCVRIICPIYKSGLWPPSVMRKGHSGGSAKILDKVCPTPLRWGRIWYKIGVRDE